MAQCTYSHCECSHDWEIHMACWVVITWPTEWFVNLSHLGVPCYIPLILQHQITFDARLFHIQSLSCWLLLKSSSNQQRNNRVDMITGPGHDSRGWYRHTACVCRGVPSLVCEFYIVFTGDQGAAGAGERPHVLPWDSEKDCRDFWGDTAGWGSPSFPGQIWEWDYHHACIQLAPHSRLAVNILWCVICTL